MKKHSLPFLLLLLFFFLAMDSVRDDSPTMDEQNHIARGLALLRTGDPRLSVEHPPLINCLSALPLLSQPIELPLDDWSWQEGEWYRFADLLLWQRNENADRIVFLARLPIIFLGMAMAAFIHRVTNRWYGTGAALLALTLVALDPNLMAHARYATTDLGATALTFLAAVLLWRASQSGYTRSSVILAGVGFGLAASAKLSALVFGLAFGLWILLDQLREYQSGNEGWKTTTIRVVTLYPLSTLVTTWAFFLFTIGAVEPGIPSVPMPEFWKGIMAILDFSGGGRPSFFGGQFSTEGFWYYFPAAFLLKTPFPTLLLLIWAAIAFFRHNLAHRSETDHQERRLSIYLLLSPSIYFLLSTQSSLNLGYRHLLPTLPFLFVFIAGQVTRSATRIAEAVVVSLCMWLLVANLAIFPHYVSYFNEIVGPSNGYRLLVDSNVDWGQDLKRLKAWMEETGETRIKLAWFGSAPPTAYDIEYDPLPGLPHHFNLWERPPFDTTAPEPGTYAISVSMLQELHRRNEEKTIFAWFREREPDDRVGYSILIYRVGEDSS